MFNALGLSPGPLVIESLHAAMEKIEPPPPDEGAYIRELFGCLFDLVSPNGEDLNFVKVHKTEPLVIDHVVGMHHLGEFQDHVEVQ